MDVLTLSIDGVRQSAPFKLLLEHMTCSVCGEPALECGNPEDCMDHVEEDGWVTAEIEVECDECEGLGWVASLCPTCNGSGEGMWDGSSCRDCRRNGEVKRECGKCGGDGHLMREVPVRSE